ncbi:MAG: hypothetical protein GF411_13750 [Candidatus Lokiarchaeota archaeon]|nr:hypothetical protein [Candidatus Lokiarchaeota archaeon]
MSRRQGKTIFTILFVWLVLSPYVTIAISPTNIHARDESKFTAADITLEDHPDMTYENGSLGKQIAWEASSKNPKNYSVTRNGETYTDGQWLGNDVIVNLDHLYDDDLIDSLPATFEFILTLFDRNNESSSDTVTVTVVADERAPEVTIDYENLIPGNENNFTYEEGGFDHIVIFAINETNPDSFNLTRQSNWVSGNFSIIDSGNWDGSNITLNADGLNSTHWYLYELFLNDTLGQETTVFVNITVLPDVTAPVVDSPDDISYEFGDVGQTLIWNIYDSNPDSYNVTVIIQDINETYGEYSEFHAPANLTVNDWELNNPDGDELRINITALYLGNYTFTLWLFDSVGYNSTDTVNLTIYEDIRAPVVNSTPDFAYEEGYTDNHLKWSADESNPKTYNLTLDGEVVMDGNWNGENLSLNVDGLDVGDHYYNMTLIDFFDQVTIVITVVTVTPDAHNPIVNNIRVISSFNTPSSNNISIQAYVWDLNAVLNASIEYYTTNSEEVTTLNMSLTSFDLYLTSVGELTHGEVLHYRVVAYDNSSQNLNTTTDWFEYSVNPVQLPEVPPALWISVLILGILSMIVILSLYFRTKTR